MREGLVWIGNWGDGERSTELEEFLLRPAATVGLFAKAQQIARVIGAILRRFHGDFFILARECGKLQGLEVIAQQHLGRNDRRRWGLL